MSDSVMVELYIFCMSIMLGIIMSFVYDIIRVFRKVITRGTVIVAIEDIVVMFVAAIITFNMIYKNNNGIIRSYIIIGILLGITLYLVSISRFIVNIPSKYIRMVLQKLLKAFKMITSKIKIEVKAHHEQSESKKRE